MSPITYTEPDRRYRGRARCATALASALLGLSIVAQPAAARPVDLRSPDAQKSTPAIKHDRVVDLRSPDARDAARQAEQERAVDLRSPDARDAARDAKRERVVDRGRMSQQTAAVPAAGASSDLTWVYITAGGVALLCLVTGAAMAGRRRRQRSATTAVVR